MTTALTPRETRVLTRLQRDLPASLRPFAGVGDEVGLSEDDVIGLTRDLWTRGVIREISALFDTRAIGYRSVLVAAEIPTARLDAAAAAVSAHPGVSHNYRREADFNLWFTLALPPDSAFGIAGTLEVFQRLTGARRLLPLPALRMFKLQVHFDLVGGGNDSPVGHVIPAQSAPTAEDIRLIRLLQEPMPIIREPYRAWGDALGLSPEAMLVAVQQLAARGFLRRIAAALHHRSVGVTANAMGVWNVPDTQVASVGACFAARREVSHCYERPRAEGWPYNVFTMVHGRTREECAGILAELAETCGVTEWQALYSAKEYKKARVQYYSEMLPRWEAAHAGEI